MSIESIRSEQEVSTVHDERRTWTTNAQREALATLQREVLAALERHLKGSRDCALIDFPDHPNVGDSLIWLGALQALRRLGVRIRYVCSDRDYRAEALRRALPENGAILINGGGNLGTLYVRHQRLREQVLADFPTRRTIQLPQSINFERKDALERMQRLVDAHREFILLVRDERSRAFAAEHFSCLHELCPDMALMLGTVQPIGAATCDYFVLSRSDKEKRNRWSDALSGHDAGSWLRGDWLEDGALEARMSLGTSVVRRAVGKLLGRSIEHAVGFNSLWQRAFETNARWRMRRGVRMLSQGRVVMTDRLHAHVLCVLMDKPHVVLGDSHGKIRAFYEAFSHRLSPAPWSDRPEEAIRIASQMLGAR